MMRHANNGFGLSTLNRAFAGALFALAVASCGGDGVGTQSFVALRFVTQPSSLTAGTPFSVSVELLASGDVRATNATDPVTLSIVGGSGLSGTTTVLAVAGLATFSGISANTAGTGVVLRATRGTLSALSTAFDVAAGAPALTASTLVLPGPVGVGIASPATFTIKDALGNPIANAAISLTTSIAGTTFTPSSGTTDSTGVFGTSANFGAAGAGTVTATVSAVALAFPVTPAVCTIGTATIGTPVVGTVSAAPDNGCAVHSHPAAIYRFTVPPSATATMVAITGTGTGTFYPELTITPDPRPSTGAVNWSNAGTSLSNGPHEWLLPSGTYQAGISSANGTGGSFTLSLATSSNTATACNGAGNVSSVRYLPNTNATYSGQQLDTTDCADPAGPYYTDFFFVFDTRPCTVTMQAAYGIYIEIDAFDLNSTLQFVDTPNLSAQVSLASCSTNQGPIAILASSHDPAVTGPYTLQVAFTGGAIRSASSLNTGPEWQASTSQLLRRIRLRK